MFAFSLNILELNCAHLALLKVYKHIKINFKNLTEMSLSKNLPLVKNPKTYCEPFNVGIISTSLILEEKAMYLYVWRVCGSHPSLGW